MSRPLLSFFALSCFLHLQTPSHVFLPSPLDMIFIQGDFSNCSAAISSLLVRLRSAPAPPACMTPTKSSSMQTVTRLLLTAHDNIVEDQAAKCSGLSNAPGALFVPSIVINGNPTRPCLLKLGVILWRFLTVNELAYFLSRGVAATVKVNSLPTALTARLEPALDVSAISVGHFLTIAADRGQLADSLYVDVG